MTPLRRRLTDAIALAGMLAAFVGIIEIALGLGKLGFVADLLSSEVQVGYMNGLVITIIVGSGPGLVPIPDVNGQTVDIATKNLNTVGFMTILTAPTDSPRPAGEVIASDPPAGTPTAKDAPITLKVSQGNQFVMPDLTGRFWVDAEPLLRALRPIGPLLRSLRPLGVGALGSIGPLRPLRALRPRRHGVDQCFQLVELAAHLHGIDERVFLGQIGIEHD